MKQDSTVIKLLDDGIALVVLQPDEKCQKCCACKPTGPNRYEVKARNLLKAKVGDRVEIDLASKNILQTIFTVFILPVVLLIFGFMLGNMINEIVGLVMAFAGVLLSLGAASIFDKKFSPMAEITRVLA